MKKFKFALEGLYRWRKEEERQREFELGILIKKAEALKREKNELEEKRLKATQQYSQAGQETGGEFWSPLLENFILGLESQQIQRGKDLEKLEKQVVAQQKRVEEAYRAKRQVEILRERSFEAYRQHWSKEEVKGLSEVGRLLHLRNMENLT